MGIVRFKLEEYLKSVNITRYQLSKRTDIKYQTIDSYYKNRVTRYDSHNLALICTCLGCDISDILEFIPE